MRQPTNTAFEASPQPNPAIRRRHETFADSQRSPPEQLSGWQIHLDAINVGNTNDTDVVLRELGGAEVPHFYGNDGMPTEVVIH